MQVQSISQSKSALLTDKMLLIRMANGKKRRTILVRFRFVQLLIGSTLCQIVSFVNNDK